METQRLYYTDSHISDFTATVLECRGADKLWETILDGTYFFPGGGGQSADTGYIGGKRVLDVFERDGEIIHCTEAPLTVGVSYPCKLDFDRRFRLMQNHSGEHIVSGLVHSKYGFDNVGFHMSADCMTIDFDGELSWEQLMETELEANRIVWDDRRIICSFPSTAELATLEYRSKLELTEKVRIVEIEGVDRCACCAPHVCSTGEIGLIKILDFMRHRGGTRVTLICGEDAMNNYRELQESVTAVSRLLSVKRGDISGAVQRLLSEQQTLKEKSVALSMELVGLHADAVKKTDGNICLFSELPDEAARRELVNLLTDKCSGIVAVFHDEHDGSFSYIIGNKMLNLKKVARTINTAINGRGGGRETMMQGRALMGRDELCKAIEGLCL